MKKILFGLAAIALAVSSCSENEEISSDLTNKKAIGFNVYTQLQTRGDTDTKDTSGPQYDWTSDNLSKFKVSALGNNANYFSNVIFEKKSSGDYNGFWTSTPQFFYPNYELEFYAYSSEISLDNSKDQGTKEDCDTIVTIEQNVESGNTKTTAEIWYKTPATMAKQQDFVTAYRRVATDAQENDSKNDDKRTLNFRHILSKVIVQASNQNSGYVVKVKNVKFANLVNEGTYTYIPTLPDGTDNKAENYVDKGTMVVTDGHSNKATSDTEKACVDYYADESADGASQVHMGGYAEKELGTTAVQVMTENENYFKQCGRWYFIPQGWKNYSPDLKASDETTFDTCNKYNNGTYLAMLVQIKTKQGALVYPQKNYVASGQDGATNNISKEGFAWICIPLAGYKSSTVKQKEGDNTETNGLTSFAQGKQYTITVNFFKNGGCGVPDPEWTPSGSETEDGKEPVPPVDNTKPIIFKQSVVDWDAVAVTIDL